MMVVLQQHAVMQIRVLQKKKLLIVKVFFVQWNAGLIQWTAAREVVFVKTINVLLRLDRCQKLMKIKDVKEIFNIFGKNSKNFLNM